MNQISIKRLKAGAALPKRATAGSAGYDLTACLEEDAVILPGEVKLIGTGIALGMTDSRYGAFLFARSGLASRNRVVPANCVGVVDSDYRGEVMIPLSNQGSEPFTVHHGDRIAQLVFLPVALPELTETEELSETGRGTGGFGSTGKK